MKKLKISVITLQNVRNYGSALQALATQEVMESLGLQCEIINYWPKLNDSALKRVRKWTKKDSLLSTIFKGLILLPTFIVQNRMFDKFNKKFREYINK